ILKTMFLTTQSGRASILALAVAFVFAFAASGSAHSPSEQQRWAFRAVNVTITRDDWGVAHVKGKTDADAVFGAIYAQAEDDFNRVETNYINAMGRLAEAEGEKAIWQDLRMKIFIDPEDLKKYFNASPESMQKLMVAWADGLNFYLSRHPEVHPRVITHFEPWMALSFTEGSIGGDIETISLDRLRQFYDGTQPTALNTLDKKDPEPSGSNGIAIAPKNTKNGHALVLINPHTSFFFHSELQMTSDEGLNAYGASTWGQFFIYQGWNDYCGWMHTSSAADAIDEYRETTVKKGGKYLYKWGKEERPVTASMIKVPYKTAAGMSQRTFTVYRTHHGPVVRKDENGNWISVALMNTPIQALMQSWGRTKVKNMREMQVVMSLHGNSSNNEIYADRDGHIAYFHANYLPIRDPKFDWTKPVDGSDPATDYKGLLSFEKSPNTIDPATGWVYNSNDWPWAAAGASSSNQADFPRWVDNGYESARGDHAVRVLKDRHDFTLDGLRETAFDSYLTWFDKRLPDLIRAWDKLPANDALRQKTADQIGVLRSWNQRWAADSVATAVAVFWGTEVNRAHRDQFNRPANAGWDAIDGKELVTLLDKASDRLRQDFGTWRTPWGDINRFQRLTGDLVQPFNDSQPSIPVPFTSAIWGSLASFGADPKPGTKKWYGTSGNSFVAVVEFGPRIGAKDVTAGGESGHPESKHFNDQAVRYANGNFRDVYFYPEQLKGHTERMYRPGQ
ncbi:MAG TPA: penicillin acylase family protein, partial [Pyrinomonadaceae bacterium]|nr:penicillin acylase family protein [Pyrinomonadaceae bacterium]